MKFIFINQILSKVKNVSYIVKLIPYLGVWNILYVFYYRISLKLGLRKKMFPVSESISGPYFLETQSLENFPDEWSSPILSTADEIKIGTFTYFSFHKFRLTKIPDWFYNPFDNSRHSQESKHWTEISDFDEGDIKVIWELSRFDWLTSLARAHKISGEKEYLSQLNILLEDWCKCNSLNVGPNWKCGQETSFRLMKLLTAACILDQISKPQESLKRIIFEHFIRIRSNINYGIAQENNHSTSESIGLYIGSCWLIKNGYTDSKFIKARDAGRILLEKMIDKLVLDQGTFSQLSVNYHRVFMDTMSFCLHMMQHLNETPFNSKIHSKLEKAGEWMYKMIMGKDGSAPNFGSNDGALIENLNSREYSDFRPSVQLFFALLKNVRIYDSLELSEAMFWRCGVDALQYPMHKILKPESEILDNQIVILRKSNAEVFLKMPDKKFRQGNDAFHVDLWHNGINVLCDSGTYSYNAGQISDYFKSVEAHNTIQFGSSEQMPKISRFLNAEWFQAKDVVLEKSDESILWQAYYVDYRNNRHFRKVTLSAKALKLEDVVMHVNNAISRIYINKNIDIKKYFTETNFLKPKIAEASQYYLEKHQINLLEFSQGLTPEKKKYETTFSFTINLEH